MQHTYIVMMSN